MLHARPKQSRAARMRPASQFASSEARCVLGSAVVETVNPE